jgi:hypothetical protein
LLLLLRNANAKLLLGLLLGMLLMGMKLLLVSIILINRNRDRKEIY